MVGILFVLVEYFTGQQIIDSTVAYMKMHTIFTTLKTMIRLNSLYIYIYIYLHFQDI